MGERNLSFLQRIHGKLSVSLTLVTWISKEMVLEDSNNYGGFLAIHEVDDSDWRSDLMPCPVLSV